MFAGALRRESAFQQPVVLGDDEVLAQIIAAADVNTRLTRSKKRPKPSDVKVWAGPKPSDVKVWAGPKSSRHNRISAGGRP
jgi:hypothetical protein